MKIAPESLLHQVRIQQFWKRGPRLLFANFYPIYTRILLNCRTPHPLAPPVCFNMHPFLMYTWSPIRTFKTCIASPILVTGTIKWSQNVYCVSDYCQRLWHMMYSCIRSESRRPDVRWHLYILPGNIRYPAEWTGVNVPVVFRMKIKISKSRISLLTSGIIFLNLLKNKIFKIKIWSLATEYTWKILEIYFSHNILRFVHQKWQAKKGKEIHKIRRTRRKSGVA